MKYLQVCGTVVCIILSIIVLQLRGLRPVTRNDLKRAVAHRETENFQDFIGKLPITDVWSVNQSVDVEVKNAIDVEVQNSVEVKTPSFVSDGKTVYLPLRVEIEP